MDDVVVVDDEHAKGEVLAGRRRRHSPSVHAVPRCGCASGRPGSEPNSTRASFWSASSVSRRRPRPAPAPALPASAPSFVISSSNASSGRATRTSIRSARLCFSQLRSASRNTDWASGSSRSGTAADSGQRDLELGRALGAALRTRSASETPGRRPATSWGARAPSEGRRARPGARRGTSGAGPRTERLAGAEREDEAEQALHHAIVDLAGQLDPLVQLAGSLVLAGRALDARRERREAPQGQHRLALLLAQLEPPAAAVGEDHSEPAPARRDRAAGQRRDPGEAARSGPATRRSRSSEASTTRSSASARWAIGRLLERPLHVPRAAPCRHRGSRRGARRGSPSRRAGGPARSIEVRRQSASQTWS